VAQHVAKAAMSAARRQRAQVRIALTPVRTPKPIPPQVRLRRLVLDPTPNEFEDLHRTATQQATLS
jgi:hypothetical protein